MWFAGGPVWDDGIVRVQSVGGTRVGMSDGSIFAETVFTVDTISVVT